MDHIIGIMGAMPEEIEGVKALLVDCREYSFGKRTYFKGILQGTETVAVFSRWGKVAAATTVSTLIHQFNITELLFTGVAGAIHPALRIGDIVIARRLIHHDMDARPLLERHEIPLLNLIYLEADETRIETAKRAISKLLEGTNLLSTIGIKDLDTFKISAPQLFVGDVASGDQFFSKTNQKLSLHSRLPDVLCVEMEGAAVAQVCFEHEIPFTVIRTISDNADDSSHINFANFNKRITSIYSVEIVKNLCHQLTLR